MEKVKLVGILWYGLAFFYLFVAIYYSYVVANRIWHTLVNKEDTYMIIYATVATLVSILSACAIILSAVVILYLTSKIMIRVFGIDRMLSIF